jgi:hypothetical protein
MACGTLDVSQSVTEWIRLANLADLVTTLPVRQSDGLVLWRAWRIAAGQAGSPTESGQHLDIPLSQPPI